VIVSAEWVVPVTRPPIQDGAILIRGDLVAEVGSRAELVAARPAEPVYDLGRCTVLPGLVNAHTHLALSVLHGVVPSAPFHEWLPRVVRAMQALTTDDFAASSAAGAQLAIASGTTVVGDIAYSACSATIAEQAGLAGVHFFEVLGLEPNDASARLADAGYLEDSHARRSDRVRHGISAHSPYTASPALISALHERAAAQSVPFAVHLAESPAEVQLLFDGTGPLAATAARSIAQFQPPGTTPARYLDRLGALDGTLAVHCVHTADDTALIAEKCAGIALCPRSNTYLQVGDAPVAALEAAGARIALGTDSLASNHDLDLFEEARALRVLAPGLTAERIVRMMTIDGAVALGLRQRFGALEPGTSADLAAFAVAGPDPYAALLDSAGQKTTAAVMSAGAWRVTNGHHTSGRDHSIDSRLAEAKARAIAAL